MALALIKWILFVPLVVVFLLTFIILYVFYLFSLIFSSQE